MKQPAAISLSVNDVQPSKRKRQEESSRSSNRYSCLGSLLLPHSTIQNMPTLGTAVGDLTTPSLLDAVCSALVKDDLQDVQPVTHATPQLRYCLSRCPSTTFSFIFINIPARDAGGIILPTQTVGLMLHEEVYDMECNTVVPKYRFFVKHSATHADIPGSSFKAMKRVVHGYNSELSSLTTHPVSAEVSHFLCSSNIGTSIATYVIIPRNSDNGRGAKSGRHWLLTIERLQKAKIQDLLSMADQPKTNCVGVRFWTHDLIVDRVFFHTNDMFYAGTPTAIRGQLEAVQEEETRLFDAYCKPQQSSVCPPFLPIDLFLDAQFASLTLTSFWEGLRRITSNFCKGTTRLKRIDLSACCNVREINEGFLEDVHQLEEVDLRSMQKLSIVKSVVSNCRNLKRFYLPPSVEALTSCANDCPQLHPNIASMDRLMTLSRSYNICEDSLENNCHVTSTLTFGSYPTLQNLTQVFCNVPHLVTLDLSTSGLSHLRQLMHLASGCTSLETVVFGDLPELQALDGGICDSDIESCGFLANCPHLERVEFGSIPKLGLIGGTAFSQTPHLKLDVMNLLKSTNMPVSVAFSESPFLLDSLAANSIDWFDLIRSCNKDCVAYLFYSYMHHRCESSRGNRSKLPAVKEGLETMRRMLIDDNLDLKNAFVENNSEMDQEMCTAHVLLCSTAGYLWAIHVLLANAEQASIEIEIAWSLKRIDIDTVKRPFTDSLEQCISDIGTCFAETLDRIIQSKNIPHSHGDYEEVEYGYALLGLCLAQSGSTPHDVLLAFAKMLEFSASYFEEKQGEGWKACVNGVQMAEAFMLPKNAAYDSRRRELYDTMHSTRPDDDLAVEPHTFSSDCGSDELPGTPCDEEEEGDDVVPTGAPRIREPLKIPDDDATPPQAGVSQCGDESDIDMAVVLDTWAEAVGMSSVECPQFGDLTRQVSHAVIAAGIKDSKDTFAETEKLFKDNEWWVKQEVKRYSQS